jgi:YD repeat-containing protein
VLLLGLVVLCSPGWALPPTYNEGGPGWDDTNIATAFEPANRRGAAPAVAGPPAIFSQTSLSVRRDGLQSADELGSANFQLAVPIVGLPGRGLDLALDLIYNSHVWHEGTDDRITYDIDADWPGPGWSLGFGKLVVGDSEESILIEPNGARHPFARTGKFDLGNGLVRFSHHTKDGSLIQYSHELRDGRTFVGEAKYPNGTLVEFYSLPNRFGVLYPTRIVDANGNYIKINYRNNVGPQIVSIIDTLGRHIEFRYDRRDRLTSITGPGLGGGTRTLVRLHYMDLPLRYAFAAGVKASSRPGPVTVIDAIYFPGTGTGYWFGDPDSYSSYGMLAQVSQRRAMSFYAGPEETEQGTISPGLVTREQLYNYPLHPDSALTRAPTYTTMTETWDGMDTPPAVTQYDMQPRATPRRMEITYPDGTRSLELYHNHPNQFDDGLPYQNAIYDAAGKLLQRTTTQWRPGERHNSPLVSRVEKTDVHGQVRAIEFDYWSAFDPGGLADGLEEVLEYDYVLERTQTRGNVMRRTLIQYENDPGYTAQYIRYLPKAVGVYERARDGWSLKSLVEYRYDDQPPQSLPTVWVVGHDGRFNPDVPVEYDKPTSDHRGNVTEVRTYADAVSRSGAVVENYRYDITGNVVAASTLHCEHESFEYTAATQYAYPTAHICGAADPASPARIKTTATYDLSTGLTRSRTDANGSTVSVEYYSESLRSREVYWFGEPGMEHRSYSYDDANLAAAEVVQNSYISDVVSQVVQRFNGLAWKIHQELAGADQAVEIV